MSVSTKLFGCGAGLCALLSVGCVPTELTSGGSRVAVGKAPPHEGCRELGIVMGSGGGGGYTDSEYKMTSAQNQIRNKTAEQGGDFVVLDATAGDVRGMTLSGRAFDCSAGSPSASAAPALAQTSGGEAKPAPATAPAPATPPTLEERLLKLKELHDKGLISDEEFAARRAEILQEV